MTITINKKEYPLHTLDTGAQELSKKRWDSIAKPLHSLGKMEDLVTFRQQGSQEMPM